MTLLFAIANYLFYFLGSGYPISLAAAIVCTVAFLVGA